MEGPVRVDPEGRRGKKKEKKNLARTPGFPLFLWFRPLSHVRAFALCFGPLLEHPHQSVREVYTGAKEGEGLRAVLVYP